MFYPGQKPERVPLATDVWIVVHSGASYALRSNSGVLEIKGPQSDAREYADSLAQKLNAVPAGVGWCP